MPQIIAKIEVTMDDEHRVHIAGTGALLQNRAFAYGLLELAKDLVRDSAKPVIQPAFGALPRM